MSVARHGPSEPQLHRLIAEVASASGPAGPKRAALAFAIAGCMGTDVAFILAKGRFAFRALRAHLVADRAQEDPHRFVRVNLRFVVEGTLPADAVERAIALSREKYCSVWHSMRQDIDFTVSFELIA